MKEYKVTGMSCAACSARVERAVSALPGVLSCNVNLLTGSMSVDGTAGDDDIITAVRAAGYGAKTANNNASLEYESQKIKKAPRTLLFRLFVSLALLLALMYLSMGVVMYNFPAPFGIGSSPLAIALLQMLLCIAVMIINKRFFISGSRALIGGAPNMDTLVSLGSLAAFVYSVSVIFDMSINATNRTMDLYFESSAMILTLITLGKMLEAYAKGKTTSALEGLIRLKPQSARIFKDGTVVEVPISEVKVGDIFEVRPGESVCVDGTVIEGESAIDESWLSGESLPKDKYVGDAVFASTKNSYGYLRCRADKVGEDTSLSKIIKMVSDASLNKAPVQKIADRVSAVFVPAVLLIAAITIIAWLIGGANIGQALQRGIAVLVISCPCSLGLATPVAIMVGSGVGAKNGILFKSATALEMAGKIKTVVFDKTGTLTVGRPQITDILPSAGSSRDELLQSALDIEVKSEHPLAKAITLYCEEHKMQAREVSDFTVLPGSGLMGTLDGKKLVGGSLAKISALCDVDGESKKAYDALSSEGKTPLCFALDSEFLGIIAVADKIKDSAAVAVQSLSAMGIKTLMITGDNHNTARAIADRIGIATVYSEIMPGDKASIIEKLKHDSPTAMVGDGINDAPALTSADIGIAMRSGTDIASDAADVVLMKSDPLDVAAAIRLSRCVLRKVKQNLFWAFLYNSLGIPIAAGAFIFTLGISLSPSLAAAAMSLSSFCVVVNALRLNFWKNTAHIKKENKDMQKIFTVSGMMCPHCEAHVQKALTEIKGVSSVTASAKDGLACVTLSEDVADSVITDAIEKCGYIVKK